MDIRNGTTPVDLADASDPCSAHALHPPRVRPGRLVANQTGFHWRGTNQLPSHVSGEA
jgi:hypothetical protein